MIRDVVLASVLAAVSLTQPAVGQTTFDEAVALVSAEEGTVFRTPSGMLLAFYVPLDLIWSVDQDGSVLDTGLVRQDDDGSLALQWNARGVVTIPTDVDYHLEATEIAFDMPVIVERIHNSTLNADLGPFPAGARFSDFFRVTLEDDRAIGNWFPFPERLLLTDANGSETIHEYPVVLEALEAE